MGKKKEGGQQQMVQEENSQEEVENQEVEIRDIMTLENINGVNNNDLQKLKDFGFPTVESMIIASFKAVSCAIPNFKEDKYQKIKAAIQKLSGESGFLSGIQLQKKRMGVKKITTGSDLMDKILGGGIESQQITEVYGEYRCGKTQLAHTLSVTAQLDRSQGGGSGKVLFIDTEGTFRPERIPDIAQRFGADPETVLENIIHGRAHNVEHQFELLRNASKIIYEEGPFSLIIVDSIMSQFRVDYLGRGELSERQQQLNLFMKKLHELAEIYNLAVFITNQVMADPSGKTQGDLKNPIGGCVLAHASTVRMSFRKGKEDSRICQLVDHPNMPETSIKFCIKGDGIWDSKDQ